MNYFKITGLENGEPIEPYGVETDASYPEINVGRNYDSARYYEPISKKEYEELIRNERNGDEKMKITDFTKEQQERMKRGGVVYDKNDGYDYCIHKGRIFRTEHYREETMWEEAPKRK